MAEEQGDRRVRRTKAMLRAALTELLKTKPVNEISVTELTRLADVNRGTFYSHYKDISTWWSSWRTRCSRSSAICSTPIPPTPSGRACGPFCGCV